MSNELEHPEELDILSTLVHNIPIIDSSRIAIGRPTIIDGDESAVAEMIKAHEIVYPKINRPKTLSRDLRQALLDAVSLGYPRTAAVATSSYLLRIYDLMVKSYIIMLQKGGINEYAAAVQYDFSKGYFQELVAVVLAHKEAKPNTEEEFLAHYDRRQGLSMFEVAKIHKDPKNIQIQALLPQLLSKDRTGYKILEWQLQEFHKAKDSNDQGRLIRSYQIPGVVIAGAEFAQLKYHQTYPRAVNILRK